MQQLLDGINRIEHRFIVDSKGCWLWQGYCERGYGRTAIKGKHFQVHKLFYLVLVGPVPDGLMLDHLCRQRNCANPEHLDPVPNAVNIARGNQGLPQKMRTHCPRGHAYTPSNTRMTKPGTRACRRCEADRALARYYAMKEAQ